MGQGMAFPPLATGTNKKLLARNSRFWLPSRLGAQPVMASPPTYSSGGSPTLARQWPTAHGDGFYQAPPTEYVAWARCQPANAQAGQQPTFNNVTASNSPTYTNVTTGAVFRHYGTALELDIIQSSTSFLLKIDDQYYSLTPTSTGTSSGAHLYHKFTFGSAANRRIELIGNNIALANIYTAATDSVGPDIVRGPRTIILGDSFGQVCPYGIGLGFGDAMGWDDVWQAALGGRGYVAGSVTFAQAVQHDVIAYNPEVVIVHGGTDDTGQTPSAVQSAAASLFATLKSSLPNAIIAAAPNAQHGWGLISANALAVFKAIKAAAASSGIVYLDMMELPLPTTAAVMSGTVTTSTHFPNAGGGIVPLTFNPPVGATIELDGASATIGERVVVTATTQIAQFVFDCTIDGTLQYSHTSGVGTAVQVGGAQLFGRGNSSSTTGYGNCDVYLDGTNHPTAAGAQAIGYQLAALFCQAFGP